MTDDTGTSIESIAERWEKATPGGWFTSESTRTFPEVSDLMDGSLAVEAEQWDHKAPLIPRGVLHAHDADAIAHAPTDVAFLLDEVKRLRKIMAKQSETHHAKSKRMLSEVGLGSTEYDKLESRIRVIVAENDRYRDIAGRVEPWMIDDVRSASEVSYAPACMVAESILRDLRSLLDGGPE